MGLFRRLRARLEPILQSDTAFIDAAYREVLGRPADLDGLNHYRTVLRDGLSRSAVLLSLMRSDEFTKTLKADLPTIPSLRILRPDRYAATIDRTNDEPIWLFNAQSPSDFDWLEAAILTNGYYEKPGVWNLGIDSDKRMIAEMIASFEPRKALELGCAAGAVLECLAERGIDAEGVEISSMAIARATDRVRPRIHQGDLLSLELDRDYDVVFGLDVFEHLNPNRIESYLTRLRDLMCEGGYLFCNIPAFGQDQVFGTVFPLYVDGWEREAADGRPFSALHVDDLGYPIHGHLTWADAQWWTKRFEACGLVREIEVERALHQKYDAHMEKRSPARKAYFVFSKHASSDARLRMTRRIGAGPSSVVR